jgi:hypothetical protein
VPFVYYDGRVVHCGCYLRRGCGCHSGEQMARSTDLVLGSFATLARIGMIGCRNSDRT